MIRFFILAWAAAWALPVFARAGETPSQVLTDVSYLAPGRAEKLDLYLPARADEDPPTPAVVWIHGGGFTGGDKAQAREREVGRVLSEAGYVCASVNYRLGADAWPTNLFDCKNAVRFLRAHAAQYHVDPDRIAVMGGSAGAHLALMVGLTSEVPELEPKGPYPTFTDDVSAIGDFYGPTDGPTRRGGDTTPPPKGTLWPVNVVQPDAPAVFIAQGLIDPHVDIGQSQELDRVLTARGVAHRLVLLANVGHSFDLETWNKRPLPFDLRSQVLAFLAQYLGIPAHGVRAGSPAPSPRITIDLDSGWRFYAHDDDRGADPALDDSAWDAVSVPHTWNAQDGQDGGDNYRRGPAWYRRHFTVDDRLKDKQLYLQFDGACVQADVYVNGKKLGTHLGAFGRFRFDATDALQPGDNVIAVRVDNSPEGVPPLAPDFTCFGGLYRPVSLVATDRVEFAMMDYASPGVFVDENRVSAQRADLSIRSEIENYEDKSKDVEVVAQIFDAAGEQVARGGEVRQHMGSGDGFTAVQDISLQKPHLWNGTADPYLYYARVTLRVSGKVRDSVTQPFGVRTARVDTARGFLLNGRPYDLHGASRYQDRLDHGWAISEADEAEDFAWLRTLGATAVRSGRYPESSSWYGRCDRGGVVTWGEIPLVGRTLDESDYARSATDQLREMIRQNYNHPSICFWGVGDPTREAPGDKKKTAPSDKVMASLVPIAKAEDASRLVEFGAGNGFGIPLNVEADAAFFDHYAGWRRGDGNDLGAYYDRLHADHPLWAIGAGAYGAGGSVFVHVLPAFQPNPQGKLHPEEYQAALHEAAWAALSSRPFLQMKMVESLFDYASDGRDDGAHPGRVDLGLVTYDRRLAKDAFYFYQAAWSGAPVVDLTSRRFLVRHRPTTEVKVYSDAAQIELTVNGKSLGAQTGKDHVFIWPHVPLVEGPNTVAATGRFGVMSVTDGCVWIYEPRAAAPPPSGH